MVHERSSSTPLSADVIGFGESWMRKLVGKVEGGLGLISSTSERRRRGVAVACSTDGR